MIEDDLANLAGKATPGKRIVRYWARRTDTGASEETEFWSIALLPDDRYSSEAREPREGDIRLVAALTPEVVLALSKVVTAARAVVVDNAAWNATWAITDALTALDAIK